MWLLQVGVAVLRRMKVAPAEDPEEVAAGFARYLHDSWGVGDRGCNNGVLLLVALQNRQVGRPCLPAPPPSAPLPPPLPALPRIVQSSASPQACCYARG